MGPLCARGHAKRQSLGEGDAWADTMGAMGNRSGSGIQGTRVLVVDHNETRRPVYPQATHERGKDRQHEGQSASRPPAIMTQFAVEETIISSILRWNLAPKKELTTLE